MEAFYKYLNTIINQTRQNFEAYPKLKWINPYETKEFQQKRDEIINRFSDAVLFKGSKPYYNQLSKGCRLCGFGKWSCLFIQGKCNASCMYCPSAQNQDETPSSQGLTFPTAESYAEYINYFGFKGVSFSGGEPLLNTERLFEYLKKIRKNCSSEIYTWMYTNGILSNEAIFRKLDSIGLDEVRFNIGASNYNLEKIKYAKGIIKNITIEIPVVPEEKKRLMELLPAMIKAGVQNLNLHQLRLTSYNVHKLIKRNYTYIPAEKPIVLESELGALEIMDYAREHHLDIGINYCSFFFKNRFQAAGFRRRVSEKLANNNDEITQNGYIRDLNDKQIEYHTMFLSDNNDLILSSDKLKLKNKIYQYNKILVSKEALKSNTDQIKEIIKNEPGQIPQEEDLFNVWKHEYIEPGLRNY